MLPLGSARRSCTTLCIFDNIFSFSRDCSVDGFSKAHFLKQTPFYRPNVSILEAQTVQVVQDKPLSCPTVYCFECGRLGTHSLGSEKGSSPWYRDQQKKLSTEFEHSKKETSPREFCQQKAQSTKLSSSTCISPKKTISRPIQNSLQDSANNKRLQNQVLKDRGRTVSLFLIPEALLHTREYIKRKKQSSYKIQKLGFLVASTHLSAF